MGLKKSFNKNTPTYQLGFSFDNQSSAKEFYEQYKRLINDGHPVSLPENTALHVTEHLDGERFPLDDIKISEGILYIQPREEIVTISTEHGEFEIKALITPLQDKLLAMVDVNSFFELKFAFYFNSQRLDFNSQRIDKGFVKITDVYDAYYKVNAIINYFGTFTADDTIAKDFLQMLKETERLLSKAVVVEVALGVVFDFSKIDWNDDWVSIAELYASIIEKIPYKKDYASLTSFEFTLSGETELEVAAGTVLSLQSIDNRTMTVMGCEITLSCIMVFVDVVVEKVSYNEENGKYILTPQKNKKKTSIFAQQFFIDEPSENTAKNEFHDNPNSTFKKYRNSKSIVDLCNEYYQLR